MTERNRRNVGELLYQTGNNFFKKDVRLFENLSKKLIIRESALSFNKTCINEQLLPKYTDIKVHDPAARQENSTKKY